MLTRGQCLDYLARIGMPAHIRRHSRLVSRVALRLGELLNCNGCRLDLKMIEAGALLHDVGKMQSLTMGGDHALIGAEMLDGVAPSGVARIVREHIMLEPFQLEGPITESLLVNYSDKRVKHEEIVSVESRYHDLIARYAKTPLHRERLLEKLELYQALEQKIFSHLSIDPVGPEIMGIRLANKEGEGAGNDETQAQSGVAGGREIGRTGSVPQKR